MTARGGMAVRPCCGATVVVMAVVKINAIEAAPGMEAELEKRFASRAGQVENMEGFRGFQLLRPTEGGTRYFVVTQWESEEAFTNWVSSRAFTQGHAQARDPETKPAATSSELLSFEVVQEVGGPQPV